MGVIESFKNATTVKLPRLPIPVVSSMNKLHAGIKFIVTLNEFVYGFKDISGIEVDYPYEHVSEGGVNDHVVFVRTPAHSQAELTFTRGLILRAPAAFADAAKMIAAKIPIKTARFAALQAINMLDPQESLESGPTFGTISTYSRTNELIGLYTFTSFGIRSWELGGVDADTSTLLIETMRIVHSGLARKPVTYVPAALMAGFDIAEEVQREKTISEIILPDTPKANENFDANALKQEDVAEKNEDFDANALEQAEAAEKNEDLDEEPLEKGLEDLKEILKDDEETKEKLESLEEKLNEGLKKVNIDLEELKESLEALKNNTDNEKAKEEIDKLKDKVDTLPVRIKTTAENEPSDTEKELKKLKDEVQALDDATQNSENQDVEKAKEDVTELTEKVENFAEQHAADETINEAIIKLNDQLDAVEENVAIAATLAS
jgi:hypothetical protein